RGERVLDLVPDTLCDGLRATLGAPNFELLRAAGAQVLTIEDADTLAAMRLLWQRLKQLVEPSSAIAFAAVLQNPDLFAGMRVGVVLSGGNVSPEVLRLAGEAA
ncbi:MAG: pyridoxal-phosphate dependent enzyme, partial [Luteimonas sp.]